MLSGHLPCAQAPEGSWRDESDLYRIISALWHRFRNNAWAVAALSTTQELVLSMRDQQLCFDAHGRQLIYEDRLPEWLGNELGSRELKGLLERAQRDPLTVRMVITHLFGDAARAQMGQVSSVALIRKAFSVRSELQGQVVAFDDDALRMEFLKATA